MKITEILSKKSSGHVSSGKFSISSIGGCWRRKYLELKGLYKEEFSEETKRIFEIGNIIHRQITRELIEKEGQGIHLVASEVNVPEHQYISGRMDNIVTIDEELVIVDVKSASDYTIKSIRNGKGCSQNYLDQVLLYMHLSNIHHGMLLFVNKKNGEMEEVEVVYDEERARILVREIEDFFHKYVEKNVEPEKCRGGQWVCECCGEIGGGWE